MTTKTNQAIPRRSLLKTLPLLGLAGLPAVHVLGGEPKPDKSDKQRKIRYAGWQVGITYQVEAPGGMSRDDLMRLLDEMAKNRMNLLSLMMLSYGAFDANHDGYCWPVKNPKLKPLWERQSINGQPKTEFVREVIQAAADRKIEIQLFMNWGIWNPEKIHVGYPTSTSQITQKQFETPPKRKPWLQCPDSPGAWQAGLDEVADLLAFYNHPNVKSYGLERISYANRNACYCPYTQKRFRKDTGGDLLKASLRDIETWKKIRIMGALKEYAAHIQKLKPKTGFWLHSQGSTSWGHDPAKMKASGIDCLIPHTIQFKETREQIHKKLARLAPNPCVLHFCTRDRRPKNYKLWIKTPEILTEAIGWIHDYPGDNLAGFMFFNANATSDRNRKTVYEQLKRFDWS